MPDIQALTKNDTKDLLIGGELFTIRNAQNEQDGWFDCELKVSDKFVEAKIRLDKVAAVIDQQESEVAENDITQEGANAPRKIKILK